MPHIWHSILPAPAGLDFAGAGSYTDGVRRLLPLILIVLAAADTRAAVEVRVSGERGRPGERVDVQAVNAPLSEILDGLARQLNIKIVYEGPPPRQVLTVDIKDRTPAEAFLSIVEGQGLAYAVVMDPSGTRVQTLLMAGGNNAPSSSSKLPPPRQERIPQPVREPVIEEPLEEAMPEDEDELPPDTGRPMPPNARPSAEPPAPPSQGVFLPAPGTDYPSSVFAPRPPASSEEQPKQPKPESTPPPFNP
jgi:hypothetical protein